MKQVMIMLMLYLVCVINAAANGPKEGAGITLTATDVVHATGVTYTAETNSAKKSLRPVEPADEGLAAYDALTTTADFNYRPAFVESKYSQNELFQDIAVSAVEAVPFGFLLTFAGIYLYEMLDQSTFQPGLKTLEEYTPTYVISIGALASLNVIINTLFFYDYKKENSDAKKNEEK